MGKLCVVLLCISSFAAGLDKPRVYVTDHDNFEYRGEVDQAGIRRVNAEQVKSLNQACPDVVITNDRKGADYIVVWDNKTWAQTSWSGHQNEFTIYAQNGDLVKSGAAHRVSAAARDICKGLTAGATSASAGQPSHSK